MQKIKQIKQQNLVKITELRWRINIRNVNENENFKNSIDVTNSFKSTLS
ncbi:hypothetical protein [Spiroplasma endosymbiont of Polydrusus pterygomalis]